MTGKCRRFRTQSKANSITDLGNSVENPNSKPLTTRNTAFEDYYKEQGIVGPEEWEIFIEFLQKPLPATFRINSSSQFCVDIRTQLQDDFAKSLQHEYLVEDEALKPLPWYPDNFAWHSNFSRKQLRRNQTLERFHEFLKHAQEMGNITRQEAVSMVPPLFLDVHSKHFVLDMCAAPGSKTFQLLGIIHHSNQPGFLPSGMVVANDVDVQRSNLLIHQSKRMCTSNLLVTNHEAQHFPGCHLSKFFDSASSVESTKNLRFNQILFDRVLCDVPCSGDGTLRKAPNIWRKWNAGMANGFHGLQLKIALRGISLLKVWGRMVYSTCSMNPVENEAVVAEILRRCGEVVELLDVSNELIQLVRRPGLKKWKVQDKGLWLSSYKDVPEHRRAGILPSMFPSGRNIFYSSDENMDAECAVRPTTNDAVSPFEVNDDEICNLPLERCMRFLPHDQNTGAFFIAVFQKHSPFPDTSVGLNGSLVYKDEELSEEAMTDNIKKNSISLDGVLEAKSCTTTQGNNLVDTELYHSSVLNEYGQTTEADGMKHQLADDDDEATGPEKVGTKRKLHIQRKWKGLDPVISFKDESVINSIRTFYGIDDSFPLHGHLVTRNVDTDNVKRIYYVSKSVKDVLEFNLLAGQQLKIASVGLKMFERRTPKDGDSQCRYCISSEGLPLVLPYITKQILFASVVDFSHLLQYKSIKFGDFVDSGTGERASKLESGCCVVILREAGQELSVPHQVESSTIAIGCWKGRSNINVMVTALDCNHLLEKLKIRTKSGDAPRCGLANTLK